MNDKQTLIIRVSENLSTKDQRDHVTDYLSRSKPGIRHTYMQNGSLRGDVKIRREKRRIFVERPRQ